MDNFPSVERNKALDHENGLYLGAVLTYEEAGKGDVEIFLLDSSDYKDAPPWSEVADIGFYGVTGCPLIRMQKRYHDLNDML